MLSRRLSSRLVAGLGLVTLLALSACATPTAPVPGQGGGGGDAPAGDGGQEAPAGDLCGLISEDEIAEASGGEVTASAGGEGECDWTIGQSDLINVRYESSFDEGLAVARQICDDEQDVSGVGDQAIWCPGIDVLYFNDGGRSLAVQLVYILEEPGRDPLEIATEIGRLAAERQ